jgi:hypothetical protein
VLSQTAYGALGFAVDLQKWRKDDDTLKFNNKNNSITCEQYTCRAVVSVGQYQPQCQWHGRG